GDILITNKIVIISIADKVCINIKNTNTTIIKITKILDRHIDITTVAISPNGVEKEALRLQIAGNELNIMDKVENQNMEMDIVFCNTALDIFANNDNRGLAKKYFEKVISAKQ
ncbi:hypothetical protein RFI_00218, partial [Reticulomyxa filosa]